MRRRGGQLLMIDRLASHLGGSVTFITNDGSREAVELRPDDERFLDQAVDIVKAYYHSESAKLYQPTPSIMDILKTRNLQKKTAMTL